ncbi:MAG: transporter [Acidobacteriia bacterium]|nr:transporter [Terriglobia bacterium]
MKRLQIVWILMALLLAASSLSAQEGFISGWENRVRSTLAEQPAWPVPLFAPSSGLTQLFRYDLVRQITPSETTTWNYGFSKGVNLVPWYKTELDILVPPYIQHNSTAKDGFGDFSMVLKYRLASANEQHGSYSVSASLTGTVPTGSYKNGSLDASVAPALHAGKGFGMFDVQTSLAAILPTGDAATLGRPVVWNVIAQYRIKKIFWPEIENNATFFHGGPNDGRVQNFISPGIVVSKIKLSSDPKSRLGLILGVGEQIATSHYHAYNHALILDARFVF